MNTSKLLLLAPATWAVIGAANAQDITSAYFLSNLTTQGTARSMGFGNALGSIGGDYSSASVNPAGLGIYRSSEISITPTLRMNGTRSAYSGTETFDNNVRFNFNSFSMVFTDAPRGKRYERRNWKAVSFAFGMNRVADLNRNYTYSGVNYNNSITQVFESDANQYPGDATSGVASNYPGHLGWESYLIDKIGQDSFRTIVPFGGGIAQTKTVEERGRVNEYTLSLGGNYKEELMLGVTLGIPSVRYSLTSEYTETLAPGNNEPNTAGFSSLRQTHKIDIKGVGVNLKVGAIYKVNNNVRVGAAIHSPSYYALNDTYSPSLYSTVNGTNHQLTPGNQMTQYNEFNYGLITPWRGILSASYIMKGIGFITADYEYANYGLIRFDYPLASDGTNSYQSEQTAINQSIKNSYQSTSNFRLGAEALLTKYFMARAGFGYYSNPFKGTGLSGQRMDFSAGLGFRSNGFFTDIAFVHSAYSIVNQPYDIDYNYVLSSGPTAIPTATTDFSLNNVAITFGVKF